MLTPEELDLIKATTHSLAEHGLTFGWSHVAKIGGLACVALLGLIGILLGVILKKQSGFKDAFEASLAPIKESLTTEVRDRKQNRDETNTNIIGLHNRIDIVEINIVKSFKDTCSIKQVACSGIVHSELEHQKKSLEHACDKIKTMQKSRDTFWQRQRQFNMTLLSKSPLKMDDRDIP